MKGLRRWGRRRVQPVTMMTIQDSGAARCHYSECPDRHYAAMSSVTPGIRAPGAAGGHGTVSFTWLGHERFLW
jgi:hypothetical protein